MTFTAPALGRRERNKLEKLERITAAATELFATHSVDEVTTQQIADKADIGAGTLFLYAKTKGELLLLVQNAHYAQALAAGQAAAAKLTDPLDALLAIVTPVVRCNRVQIENGRTYLREMVFGDPGEPHHAEALSIVARTKQAYAEVLTRGGAVTDDTARTLAHVISSITFLTMASGAHLHPSTDAVIADIRTQIAAVLPQ
ncbi:AcrR family transcriptional regulator [Leucobacter exalbidus]|uniref:AcrR family transcriptional regulator n=1 Tax=Leucobacter exalbidus TaxID=662960 RepID=A0A940SZL3_9MICO|nr:TetR/AcrR family transcriptional regulator [Leucobacter exalbidus]MBP1325020.1 AcrR family transcriptional regulator [Leucobacter exalbidus]